MEFSPTDSLSIGQVSIALNLSVFEESHPIISYFNILIEYKLLFKDMNLNLIISTFLSWVDLRIIMSY